MADEDLEKLLGEEEKTAAPVEEQPKETKEEPQQPTVEELAAQAAKDELIQLGKAKAEALAEISRLRKEKQALKKGKVDEEEELPEINFKDPSAKAWDKHIQGAIQPALSESEKEKAEILETEVQKFLTEKPALAKNPEKVKELMETFESLSSGKITGKVPAKVQEYLVKAYGAITYQEREIADEQARIKQAELDAEFSASAISKGATGYQSPKTTKRKYSEEEKLILAQWEKAGAPKLE